MSDRRRHDRHRQDTAPDEGAARQAARDLDCAELTEWIVKGQIAKDAFDHRPGLRQAIEYHLEGCAACRRKSDSVRAALDAAVPPTPEAVAHAWDVLRAAARRERGDGGL